MALNAAQQWWVRTGGSETNGGGYDGTISGAGTNYADQDAAQVVFSSGNANRLNCTTGTTTVTSDGTPFTSAMVGNIIRISGGTHWTTGYYAVTAFTSSSQISVDRDPTDGTNATLGVGSLGGAHANINSYANGGGGTQPILATPLAAGHTVNVRGGGTDDPGAADYGTSLDYLSFPNGDATSGWITWKGYNGRPCLSSLNGLIFYTLNGHRFTGLKLLGNGSTLGGNGLVDGNGAGSLFFDNCYIDAAGSDTIGVQGAVVIGCRFSNSGSTASGTTARAAILTQGYGSPILVMGNRIKNWRGSGIATTAANSASTTILNNVITGCKGSGIKLATQLSYSYNIVVGNTVDSCSGDGITLDAAATISALSAFNNILTTNGGYGINCSVGSSALNDRLIGARFDYNNFGTGATANTSGARNNHSAGTHDLALDPQFTNTATDDYSVGTNMKGVGFPHAFPT